MKKFLARSILSVGKVLLALSLLVYALPVAIVFGFLWLIVGVGYVVEWANENQ
jgi:hypothetical protein